MCVTWSLVERPILSLSVSAAVVGEDRMQE